jgi:hypothetical protein
VTDEYIPPTEGHIDHRHPLTFEVIVLTFLQSQGLDYDRVPITKGEDEQVLPKLTDPELAEAFQQYHARIAQLEFVKNSANLSQAPQQRIQTGRVRIIAK